MRFLLALPLAREFEMQRNIGSQKTAVILADQVAIPVRVAVVEDRHHVNIEARTPKRHQYAVGLWRHLICTEIGERLAQAVGQIVQKRWNILRCIGPAYVTGHVNVVERAQGKPFREAA